MKEKLTRNGYSKLAPREDDAIRTTPKNVKPAGKRLEIGKRIMIASDGHVFCSEYRRNRGSDRNVDCCYRTSTLNELNDHV